jgi:triosephosphate isomerase
MYFDLPATTKYLQGVAELDTHAQSHNVDLFVIPDFVTILEGSRILKDTKVLLGAQDAFWEDRGAYTGEVSPLTLSQAGVKIVEIGHAERRRIFGETDKQVALKCAAAARNGLMPLICVGEKASSPIASAAVGMAVEEVRPQVLAAVKAIPDVAEIIIAYEPVWAIGASEPAGADHVVAVAKAIRELVKHRKGVTRILYGGSAGPGTYKALAEGVDGLFLGRFAHDLGNLRKVIEEVGGS